MLKESLTGQQFNSQSIFFPPFYDATTYSICTSNAVLIVVDKPNFQFNPPIILEIKNK